MALITQPLAMWWVILSDRSQSTCWNCSLANMTNPTDSSTPSRKTGSMSSLTQAQLRNSFPNSISRMFPSSPIISTWISDSGRTKSQSIMSNYLSGQRHLNNFWKLTGRLWKANMFLRICIIGLTWFSGTSKGDKMLYSLITVFYILYLYLLIFLVFHPYTYEGFIDLESVNNPLEKLAI